MSNTEFYKQILDNIYDGVYFVDNDRNIIYWNKGAETITGYSEVEVIGRACYDNILSHIDSNGDKLCDNGCHLSSVLSSGEKASSNVYFNHKDGYIVPVNTKVFPIFDSNGVVSGAVEVFSDRSVEVELENNLAEMRSIAMICPLTNISNRRHIITILKSKKNELDKHSVNFGVLFVDIDNFKAINDTYGHDVGDEILKMLGSILDTNVRKKDTVGRWGGEEFVCVLSISNADILKTVAEKLRIMTEKSKFNINDDLLRITISIGATMAKQNESVEEVVNRADELMYKSKQNGRNQVTIG
ncbi:sensor domain-containing diguanylate cyclase [Mycoplasmatota bacterium WC44]